MVYLDADRRWHIELIKILGLQFGLSKRTELNVTNERPRNWQASRRHSELDRPYRSDLIL